VDRQAQTNARQLVNHKARKEKLKRKINRTLIALQIALFGNDSNCIDVVLFDLVHVPKIGLSFLRLRGYPCLQTTTEGIIEIFAQ
jgi:hypothetical protein